MLFDDGSTSITLFPESGFEVIAEDSTQLERAHTGKVIAAAAPGGRPPQRTRRLSLVRTTAERSDLKTFFDTNDGITFLFTDDVGRIWDCKWLGDFDSVEQAPATDGDHHVRVRLLLEGVNSDAGREAWGNTDASQMDVTKSGGSTLYFPLAFRPPFPRTDVAAASKILHRTGLAVDASRNTARRTHRVDFANLPRAFISELDDWFVNTIAGATHPFSLAHFRETTTNFRWTGGLRFTMQPGGNYSGGFDLLEEI